MIYITTKEEKDGRRLRKGHQKFFALKSKLFPIKGHSKIWSTKNLFRPPKLGAKFPPMPLRNVFSSTIIFCHTQRSSCDSAENLGVAKALTPRIDAYGFHGLSLRFPYLRVFPCSHSFSPAIVFQSCSFFVAADVHVSATSSVNTMVMLPYGICITPLSRHREGALQYFSDEWISVSHSKTLQSSPDYSLHNYVCL